MPTYSYEHVNQVTCKYGVIYDLVQPITEDALKECPNCLEPVKRVITSAPMVRFTGTGFTPKFHG